MITPCPTSEKLQNSKPLKGGKTREQIVARGDGRNRRTLSQCYGKLIHTLKENDVKITGKDFIRDIGFMNEVLKSILFRELGYTIHYQDLIPYIIVPTRTKDKKDIYTKFRGDLVAELDRIFGGRY